MALLKYALSKFEFKNDVRLHVLAGVLILGAFVLVALNKVSWEVASAWVASILVLPGLFGKPKSDSDSTPPKPPSSGGASGGGGASAAFGLVLAAVACFALNTTACSSVGKALKDFDSINAPADDAALKKCRDEGRAARDAGASKEDAYKAYTDCTDDAGLRD